MLHTDTFSHNTVPFRPPDRREREGKKKRSIPTCQADTHSARNTMHTKETKAHTHTVIKLLNAKVEVKMGRITRDARKLLIRRLGGKKKEKHAMYNEVLTRARHVKSLAAGLLLSHRLLGSRKGQKKYTMKGNDEKRNCSSAYTFYSDGGGTKWR